MVALIYVIGISFLMDITLDETWVYLTYLMLEQGRHCDTVGDRDNVGEIL